MNTERLMIKINADGDRKAVMDPIAAETAFRIYVNDELFEELQCSPQNLRELAIGYFYVNGWVDSKEQLKAPFDIREKEKGLYEARLYMQINQKARELAGMEEAEAVRRTADDTMTTHFMSCMDTLLHASKAFQETGCIHAAGLFEMYETEMATPLYVGEDISRYYALYKAVGKAVEAGADFSELCLCTTGRLPVGYMERVIRSGISCVISRSAPTDAALSLAERYGVLTFGFAGGKRINLYPTLTGCAVLAGGMATRMGGVDKTQMICEGEPFLCRIRRQLPTGLPQYLSYNRKPEDILPYSGTAVIVPDRVKNIGPLGGIEALLHQAGKDGCVRLIIVACDMPLCNNQIIETMLSMDDTADVVVFRTGDGRVQTLCGMYRVSCLPVIEQMIEEKCYKLRVLLDRVKTRYLQTEEYRIPDEWFMNVNTPEDYIWKK